MSRSPHPWLALGALLAAAAAAAADQPAAVRPPTRAEVNHREAERLYAQALLQERESRLVDALETLEKAVRLDPDSAHLHRALVPLYLAVDRPDEALRTCRKALDLEPGDFETWFLYARQLKIENQTQDAITALRKAAACPGLKDRPDLRLQIHFDLGVLHESAQEFDKAAAAFTEVVGMLEKGEVPPPEQGGGPEQVATQAAETYERLGRVCVRARRFDEAIAAYRKAQQKDHERQQRLSYNLADVYVGQGKLREALDCLDDYLRTQPQSTEAYERKIDLLRRLGRGDEVLGELEKYCQADAQNLALKLLVARQYGEERRTDEALRRYEDLLRQSPTPEVYRGLLTLYREQGRPGAERVLSILDRSIAAAVPPKEGQDGDRGEAAKARAMLVVLRDDPKLVKAMLDVVRGQMDRRQRIHRETCRYLAILADRAHALKDAEDLYRACLAGVTLAPRSEEESDAYTGLLNVLWQEHKYRDIVDVCRQGLAHAAATNLLVFHYNLSRAQLRLGNLDDAIAEANRAVDIATSDEHRLQMRCYRAGLLAMADRFAEAEADAQGVLKDFKNPGQVLEARYTLSEVYSLAKKYAQAEEQLQRILKEHPDEARAHNDLGYQWADQGKNLEEAEKLIRQAIELDRKQKKAGAHVETDSDRDNAAYLDSLGWVLFRRGRLGEARAEMEKACALPDGADDPVVWDHMGDVYHKLGETARARSAWQKAVELYGGSGRRRPDDRLKDIEHKLRLLGPTGAGR
jgi:tetratricopeptide (TPR) repeat protein